MTKGLLLLILFSLSCCSLAADHTGSVCLGKNLAKTMDEQSPRLYLTVDDSDEIYFAQPYSGPSLIAQGLDLTKDHWIKVYLDGEIVQSWILNYAQLDADSVLIWRAPGSWRMTPTELSACRPLQNSH